MRDGPWWWGTLAAALAAGVALIAYGLAASSPRCPLIERGTDLLRTGANARALVALEGKAEPKECAASPVRAFNRALAHARLGRAARSRDTARAHLVSALRGFSAVLEREPSARDARRNRALVADWLTRLSDADSTSRSARSRAGDARDGPAAATGTGEEGRGAAGGAADADPAGGGGATGTRGRRSGEGRSTGERRDAAGGSGRAGEGSGGWAALPRARALAVLRRAASADRRLRARVVRRLLTSDTVDVGRW